MVVLVSQSPSVCETVMLNFSAGSLNLIAIIQQGRSYDTSFVYMGLSEYRVYSQL